MIYQLIIFRNVTSVDYRGPTVTVKEPAITFTCVAWHCTSSRVVVNGRLGG